MYIHVKSASSGVSMSRVCVVTHTTTNRQAKLALFMYKVQQDGLLTYVISRSVSGKTLQ